MEPVEATARRHELGPLFLERLSYRLLGNLRMPIGLGVSAAAIEDPTVRF
jgi:hypothetical protein